MALTRRLKQLGYLLIGAFLLTAAFVAGFSDAGGPQAAGYNVGMLGMGVLIVWLTVRAVRRA